MADSERPDALGVVARFLSLALRGLEDFTGGEDGAKRLFWELGFEFPVGLTTLPIDTNKLASLVAQLDSIESAIVEGQGDPPSTAEYVALVIAAGAVVEDLSTAGSRLAGLLDAQYLSESNIAALFSKRLLDFLLLNLALSASAPVTYGLAVLGVVDLQEVPADPAAQTVDHLEGSIKVEVLGEFVANPKQALAKAYGWGSAAPTLTSLLTNLARLGGSLGVRVDLSDTGAPGSTGDDLLTVWLLRSADGWSVDLGLSVALQSAGSLPSAALLVEPSVSSTGQPMPVGPGPWQAAVTGSWPANVGISISPTAEGGATVALSDTITGDLTVELGVTWQKPAASTSPLFSSPLGSFDARSADVSIGAKWSGTSPELFGRVDVTGGTVGLALGGDGFLSSILPADSTLSASPSVLASSSTGLAFVDGHGLSIDIPLDAQIAVARITSLTFAVTQVSGGAALAIGASATAVLGPVTVSVAKVGALLSLVDAPSGGRLGSADFQIEFNPPVGVGLAINTDVVAGGGFVTFDKQHGQYAGAVQLKLASLSLAAVGLIATRMPSGAPGYSMVVLLSVHFPPVEMGFGFAIDGVGGLLGVNRTVALDPLRAGLQKGSLDAVLFPADLTQNPQKVVSDLEQYFPSAQGQYVVGPTVELLWGVDGLLTATVGIFVEFPSPTRVIIAGKLRLALPVPQAAVADIRMDLLGDVDFAAKLVAIDAVLRDSRIAAFTLTGQAALRASWGAQPAFLFAAGGWNPDFTPPASFPQLSRLALALSQSSDPRIRFEAYLALTSNTLQLGANVDLSASVGVPVVGTFGIAASLGFDALIQFDPFGFVVEIHASVSLTWNKKPFLAIQLALTLSGPHPWHAVGKATFKCFGTHSVQFAFTSGDASALPAPPTIDGADELVAALSNPANWTGELSAGGVSVVLGGSAQTVTGLLLHPLGRLTVKQRLLPLDLQITHLGQARLANGPTTFSITAGSLGGTAADTAVTGAFAPAQFLDLSDDEKLSRSSFEQHGAGVMLGATGYTFQARSAVQASAQLVPYVLTRDPNTGALTAPSSADQALAESEAADSAGATEGLSDALLRVQSRAGTAALSVSTPGGPGALTMSLDPVAVLAPTYEVVDRTQLNPVVASLQQIPNYSLADQSRLRLSGLTLPGDAQVVQTTDAFADAALAVPGLDPGAYYFLIAVHSSKCLAVLDDSLAKGAPIVQRQGTDSGSEYWRFEPVGDGSYHIIAEHSRMALGAQQIGTVDGTRVTQSTDVVGFNQQWRLVCVAPRRYRIELVSAGRCLDVVGAAQQDGTPVQIWDWWGGENQQWELVRVSDAMLLHQQILERAFEIWQQEGAPLWSQALADWQRASAEVLAPVFAREAEAQYERRGRGPSLAQDDWYAAVHEVTTRIALAGDWSDEIRDAVILSAQVRQ